MSSSDLSLLPFAPSVAPCYCTRPHYTSPSLAEASQGFLYLYDTKPMLYVNYPCHCLETYSRNCVHSKVILFTECSSIEYRIMTGPFTAPLTIAQYYITAYADAYLQMIIMTLYFSCVYVVTCLLYDTQIIT